MIVYYLFLFLGLVCLTGPWIARHFGYEARGKPYDLIGTGGVFFLLGAFFGIGMEIVSRYVGVSTATLILPWFQALLLISLCIAWVAMIGGVTWAADKLVRETEHKPMQQRAVNA
jgi:hypothetical protein